MGKVIGPFDLDDWYTMLALKQSIAHLRNKKPNPKTKFSLRNEIKLFKSYISKDAA